MFFHDFGELTWIVTKILYLVNVNFQKKKIIDFQKMNYLASKLLIL